MIVVPRYNSLSARESVVARVTLVTIVTLETLGFSGSNITFRDPNIAGDVLSSDSFTVDSIIIGTPTINAGNSGSLTCGKSLNVFYSKNLV